MQANARYYHLYQNNVCYEFSLGLQTVGDETNKDMKPVNRDKVFDKLTWMLSTVKIKDGAVVAKTPGNDLPAVSTTETTPPVTSTAAASTAITTPNNQ